MVGTTALIIASIIASLAAAGAGVASSAINYNAQKEANKTNVELQNSANTSNVDMQAAANNTNLEVARMNNETQLDIAKHAHQYEMEDLKAAGLNPVLTATGGSGASIGALSMPSAKAAQVQAPRVQAPQLDLTGLANAINSMSHFMLISKLSDDRNNTFTQNTNSRNAVLNNLYKRKAEQLGSNLVAQTVVNSAKSLAPNIVKSRQSKLSNKQYEKILKDLGY